MNRARPMAARLISLQASVAKRFFVRNYSYENVCHMYVHSHENQVIFMWNALKLRSEIKVCLYAQRLIRPALIPVSVAATRRISITPWMECYM